MPVKPKVETVTFTTKGQLVIPSKLRSHYEIEAGTKATVESTAEGILIKPITAVLISQARGILNKGTLPLVQEWAEYKAEERKLEDE